MKKYYSPELNVEVFINADVIMTSFGEMEEMSKTLKTEVNGKEGVNYGFQNVSIFD